MKQGMWALSLMWAILLAVGIAVAKEDKSDLFLGVYVDEVTSDIASDYGVKAGEGVLVTGIVNGSPADEVGLRENDILIKLAGATLTGPAELRHQIQQQEADKPVSLTYMRGGNKKTVDLELVERESRKNSFFSDRDFHYELPDTPDSPEAPQIWREIHSKSSKQAFMGIVTQELSEGLQEYFKVESGALIAEVVEGSPAEEAGLKAGDVLIKIGTRDIDGRDDVSRVIRKYDPGDEVDVVVKREGKEMAMKLTLTSRKDYYGSEDSNIILGLGNGKVNGVIVDENGDLHEFSHDLSRELEGLDVDMEELQWNLKDLEDLNLDMSIEADPPILRMNFDDARAINADQSWWQRSWTDMKSRLTEEFEQLRENFEQLKQELKQLQEEFKARML